MQSQNLTAPFHAGRNVDAELSPDPMRMDLTALMRRCTTESERFYNGQTNDTRFAYELFRRALVERDELAWDYIYTHYSPLLESWVRRCSAFPSSGESTEFFISAAFTKFWRAVTAERFASFPSLAALLQYLQLCTTCVVIDNVRTQAANDILPMKTHDAHPTALYISPDEEALERVNREDFWKYINAQLHSEAERVVVFKSFLIGMKPGEIQEQHPDLFATVKDVYSVKRNVLERLSRNSELKQMTDHPSHLREKVRLAPRGSSRAMVVSA